MKKVGDYEIGEVLGTGGYAIVRKVKHSITQKEYAVKILDKEKIHKERMADALRKEVLLMKMLTHPNVVKLEEVLSSRSKLFLVIELVNGGDLFELLDKEDYLNENHAREIF